MCKWKLDVDLKDTLFTNVSSILLRKQVHLLKGLIMPNEKRQISMIDCKPYEEQEYSEIKYNSKT